MRFLMAILLVTLESATFIASANADESGSATRSAGSDRTPDLLANASVPVENADQIHRSGIAQLVPGIVITGVGAAGFFAGMLTLASYALTSFSPACVDPQSPGECDRATGHLQEAGIGATIGGLVLAGVGIPLIVAGRQGLRKARRLGFGVRKQAEATSLVVSGAF